MKYDSNYYVNGFGFEEYEEAKRYADFLLEWKHMYKCVFTRAEMNAIHEQNKDTLNDYISHFNLG